MKGFPIGFAVPEGAELITFSMSIHTIAKDGTMIPNDFPKILWKVDTLWLLLVSLQQVALTGNKSEHLF